MLVSATVQILHGLNPNPDKSNATKNDVLPRIHLQITNQSHYEYENASGAI